MERGHDLNVALVCIVPNTKDGEHFFQAFIGHFIILLVWVYYLLIDMEVLEFFIYLGY